MSPRRLCGCLVSLLACGGCGGGGEGGGADLRVDCIASPATCGCAGDGECGGANPRCLVASGACVPCLPDGDNCPAGRRCVAAGASYACAADCKSDDDCPRSDAGAVTTCCDHACVDAQGDARHCGGCGVVCPAVAHGAPGCALGVCGVGTCNAGYADCDRDAANGCEVATDGDAKNCGACGKACAAGPNSTASCAGGACALACAAGWADCDKEPASGCESRSATDAKNCGGCGMDCGALANATAACVAGACAIGACAKGYADCDKQAANGCEVDTQGDAANCNACGNACSPAHGTGACSAGRCAVAACNEGYTDCNKVAGDGCEVGTGLDPDNCGSCGHTCAGAHSTQGCKAGACVVAACDPGWDDCDGSAATGCEASVAADVQNCGKCKNVCPIPQNATASCVSSQCGIGACKQGFDDCNASAIDGCEANLASPLSCATCNVQCSIPQNATAGCNQGACGIGACAPLFGDCNADAADGCEHDLAADVANCGACGRACVTPNATPRCGGGACSIMLCAQGFSDCDFAVANGCESPTAADPANCGGCGKACPPAPNALPVCTNSACGLACSQGYADCNQDLGDGCEIAIQIDLANCGSCLHQCPAVAHGAAGCSSGTCGVAMCNMPWADCNASAADGCEKDLSSDAANCGMCGKACAFANAVAGCTNSQCTIASCKAGWADCDGNLANGCEAFIAADPANCGACRAACPVNTPYCSKSVCSASQALVGQFYVDAGPSHGLNPAPVSCVEECAALFGGAAAQYSCSISNAAITHTAWMDGYADAHCAANPLGEGYKKGASYECGSYQCAYSAYVNDHTPACHVLDYCYR